MVIAQLVRRGGVVEIIMHFHGVVKNCANYGWINISHISSSIVSSCENCYFFNIWNVNMNMVPRKVFRLIWKRNLKIRKGVKDYKNEYRSVTNLIIVGPALDILYIVFLHFWSKYLEFRVKIRYSGSEALDSLKKIAKQKLN
jgi:hypothetical protein